MLGAALAISGGLVLGAAPQAQAHQRDFVFSYDWFQPSKGEKELESHTIYDERKKTFKQQLELEYGVSKRFAIAPYILFEKERGESLKYKGYKVETRYQLGNYKTGAILPGLYLEYANEKGESAEVEGKLILSRYGKDGSNLTFNYAVERRLENGAELEHKYTLGYARDLGKSGARIGAEWIHDLSSGRIKAGPTVGFNLGRDVWVVTGYAFPVNSRDGNKGEFRLLAEYEF